MAAPRQSYSDEFRNEAVRLATSNGKSRRAVARELGIGHETLRRWIQQAETELESPMADPPEQHLTPRQRLPRKQAGAWNPDARGHDALATILAQNEMRAPDLVPIRHGRMSASPWTYYRGAAAVMAADLASRPNSGLTVQLCGDAHVLNFGLWASPERALAFDLRDFDETLPGPFEWDVLRMVTSFQVLASDNALSAKNADKAVQAAVRAYQRQMAIYAGTGFLDIWYDQLTASDIIAAVVPEEQSEMEARIRKRAQDRTNAGAVPKFTELVNGRRQLIEEPPFRWRNDIVGAELVEEVFSAYRMSLSEERRYLLDRYTFVDTVRQVVGVGSVGMRVYLALLQGTRDDDLLFLQFKQAGPSVYEQFLAPSVYPNHGQRVTVGRRYIQSSTDILTGWTGAMGMDFYVRQFRDMKVIPRGDRLAPYLIPFAEQCGRVMARAHACTGDAAAISTYLGKNETFVNEMVRFARAYADQNAQDHAQLAIAVADGSIESAPGW